MPVQINEIVIRVNIVETPIGQSNLPAVQTAEINREDLIRECTDVILEILSNQNER